MKHIALIPCGRIKSVAKIKADIIAARLGAIGINSARIIEKEHAAGGSRVEFWVSTGLRFELEPLVVEQADSYHLQSFTHNHTQVGCTKLYQSELHTAMYVEALAQIERGL